MKRRAFIAGLEAATLLPSLALAQQAKRRIGVLMAYAESEAESQARVAMFPHVLTKLGWIEGQNLALEIRWSTASPEKIGTTRRNWSLCSLT